MQAPHERVKALIQELEWLAQNLAHQGASAATELPHLVSAIADRPTSHASGVSREIFSARQLAILQGMVEGKTNHDLASDLGFSVSTIRHETMRIYQLLGVSDRREAAREALDQGIL